MTTQTLEVYSSVVVRCRCHRHHLAPALSLLQMQAVIVDNQPCLLFNFEVQSVGACNALLLGVPLA